MTFKKEISIDGVAVICASVALCVWLVTLKNTQSQQGEVLVNHTQELKEIHSILVQEQLKNEATDVLQKTSFDHETRIRVLEKDADFLKIAH